MSQASPPSETVTFRGGIIAGLVPLGVFMVLTFVLVVLGAPTIEGMIIAAMIGISAGMLFAHNFALYNERVFTLMANRVATVAIVCWLWAGAFAGVLGDSKLVEAIVWLGWKSGLQGAGFVVVTFLSASLFAVFTGTGLGTVIGFTTVMYPAGVILGANPAALLGAIISGGAFGDNLAPISDTTIVSATTQETDVPGVVKSRLKYVITAGVISAIAFYLLGKGESLESKQTAETIIAQTADPQGLPMFIPPLIVFIVAVTGHHFLAALTAGIVSACLLGPLLGIFSFTDVFSVGEGGITQGSLIDGAMGLVPTAILTLLLVTAIGIMSESGLLGSLLKCLEQTCAKTVRGAEMVILLLISFANFSVSVNTVAMITAGPFANEIRKRHNIHPHRSANLLDTVSCSFPYLLPYAAITPAILAQQKLAQERHPFIEVLAWNEFAPYAIYCVILLPIMILAIATGFGRKSG